MSKLSLTLCTFCYNLKSLEWDKGQTLVLEKTQENLIKSSLQNSLPYILLQMVCASYYASYPKWPCVKHEANMWFPCCMTSFCSRTFYFLCQEYRKVNLISFYFYFLFLFLFWLIFHSSILRTLGLGLEVISHTVISVTSDGVVTTLIMGLRRRK